MLHGDDHALSWFGIPWTFSGYIHGQVINSYQSELILGS
jgi:hypothetical protein